MNREIEQLIGQRDAIQRRINNLVAECPHTNKKKTKTPYFDRFGFCVYCKDCGKLLQSHWPYNPELDGLIDE